MFGGSSGVLGSALGQSVTLSTGEQIEEDPLMAEIRAEGGDFVPSSSSFDLPSSVYDGGSAGPTPTAAPVYQPSSVYAPPGMTAPTTSPGAPSPPVLVQKPGSGSSPSTDAGITFLAVAAGTYFGWRYGKLKGAAAGLLAVAGARNVWRARKEIATQGKSAEATSSVTVGLIEIGAAAWLAYKVMQRK